MQLTIHTAPLSTRVIGELSAFWSRTFGSSDQDVGSVLGGAEREINRNQIYLMRDGRTLAGSCQVTTPLRQPLLCGMQEVATSPQYRRRGVASALCGRARDEFLAAGAGACFLGTGNPEARRVYQRLGWRGLDDHAVMMLTADGLSPRDFLSDYFNASGDGATGGVHPGGPHERVTLIPLCWADHSQLVLDANTKLMSTRHGQQRSCMGLYARYEKLTDSGGAWWVARDRQGRAVGIASVRPDSGGYHVDGFTHATARALWPHLIGAARQWTRGQGTAFCRAQVVQEDEEKLQQWRALGWRDAGTGETIDIGGRRLATTLLDGPVGA